MASTGNVFPTVGANVDRAGNTAWTNPGNVVSDNTTDATVAVPSDYLVTSGYGFAIPAAATILGVTVRVEASETGAGTSTYIPQLHSDTTPTLIGAAKGAVTVSGTTKAISTTGGAADLWGAALTPAIVNAAGFGVTLWSTDTVNTLAVDYVTIAIAYTLNGRLRATPGRLVAAVLLSTLALTGKVRDVERLPGATLTQKVALAGRVRATARLVGTTQVAVVASLAGTGRATPARLVSTGLVLGYKSSPVRELERLRGATLTHRLALAGRLRVTPARLVGDLPQGTTAPLAGTSRTSQRLTGALTTRLALTGVVRGSPARLFATGRTRLALAGTDRATPARLRGSLQTTTALTGTLRSTPARLRASLTSTTALAGTLRTVERLVGSLRLTTTLTGKIRATPVRLRGVVVSQIALRGTVRETERLTGAVTQRLALTGTLHSAARLTGALTQDVALAGTAQATGARLYGAIGARVALAGTARSSARLTGALTQKVALAGTARSSGRLTGELSQNVALAGTLRSSARVRDAFLTTAFTVPLTGVARATPARLYATLAQRLALVGKVRDVARIRGATLSSDLALQGMALATPVRLRGQVGTRGGLTGVVAAPGARLLGATLATPLTAILAGQLEASSARLAATLETRLALGGRAVAGVRLRGAGLAFDLTLAGRVRATSARLLPSDLGNRSPWPFTVRDASRAVHYLTNASLEAASLRPADRPAYHLTDQSVQPDDPHDASGPEWTLGEAKP